MEAARRSLREAKKRSSHDLLHPRCGSTHSPHPREVRLEQRSSKSRKPSSSGRCEWSALSVHSSYQLSAQKHEGNQASTTARLTDWSSGARRREKEKPKLYASLGDPIELINEQCSSSEQLSGRNWWPADEKPQSFWDTADFGLTMDTWLAFPKLGAPFLPLTKIRTKTRRLSSAFPRLSPLQLRFEPS